MSKPSPWTSGVRIVVVTPDGTIIGSENWTGEPAVAIGWCSDPLELTRRASEALSSAGLWSAGPPAAK